jgi:hypothetical protein
MKMKLGIGAWIPSLNPSGKQDTYYHYFVMNHLYAHRVARNEEIVLT